MSLSLSISLSLYLSLSLSLSLGGSKRCLHLHVMLIWTHLVASRSLYSVWTIVLLQASRKRGVDCTGLCCHRLAEGWVWWYAGCCVDVNAETAWYTIDLHPRLVVRFPEISSNINFWVLEVPLIGIGHLNNNDVPDPFGILGMVYGIRLTQWAETPAGKTSEQY